MSDLVELAKRTYETSASILDQAKRLSKHVEASSVRVKETEAEVVTLTYDAEKELQETGLLCDRLKKEALRREDDLKVVETKQAEVDQLVQLFKSMDTVQVAPWITGDNEHPLLEYVDSETVFILKGEAEAKALELKEMCNAMETKVLAAEKELHQAYETIAPTKRKDGGKEKGDAALFSFDLESVRSKLREHLHVVKEVQEKQEVTIQEISRISLKAAGAYDGLLNGKEEATKETVLGYGESLKEGLKKVAGLTQDLNQKLKTATEIKSHLQTTRPTIERLLESVKRLGDSSKASAYQGAYSEIKVLLDDLIALFVFYSNFERAHEAIPAEIERRWNYVAKLEDFAKAQQAEIDVLVKAEIVEREAFHAKYGRFLPASLCPALAKDAAIAEFRYYLHEPNDVGLLHACISQKQESTDAGN